MAGQLLASTSNAMRTFWSRMTSTRLTMIYFVFAIINCGVQTGLQTRAFLVNQGAATLLDNIVRGANLSTTEFAMFNGTTLQLCMGVPGVQGNCEIVWENTGNVLEVQVFGSPGNSSTSTFWSSPNRASTTRAPTSTSQTVASSTADKTETLSTKVSPSPTAVTNSSVSVSGASPTATTSVAKQNDGQNDASEDLPDDEGAAFVLPIHSLTRRVDILVQEDWTYKVSGVPLVSNGTAVSSADVTLGCATVLAWPLQSLDNIKRTDAVFIAFQIWVLGMSILALLNESIPHVAAAFLTHMFATAYSAYQLVETAEFRNSFLDMTVDGACHGVNLLPDYWQQRGAMEIPMLAINCAGLLFSAFLTWRLVKRFGWQTFKRIGASLAIHRYYSLLMVLSVSIQLSAFFVIAFLGLWIDQLNFGSVGQFDSPMDRMVFEVIYIVLLVLIVPWLVSGWYAMYREKRILMMAFLVVAGLLVLAWGLMFLSLTYRWTFISWTFFAVLSTITAFLVTGTFILGIVCRLNFSKGLLDYLSDEAVDDVDPFVRDLPNDTEKIHFPTSSDLPTFSSRPPSMQITAVESNSSVAGQPAVEFYQQMVRTASISSSRSASSNASESTRSGSSLTRVDSKDSSNSGRSGASARGRSRGRFLLE